jgi:hypothetical protein
MDRGKEYYAKYLRSKDVSEKRIEQFMREIDNGMGSFINMCPETGECIGVAYYHMWKNYRVICMYHEEGEYLMRKFRDKFCKIPTLIGTEIKDEIEYYIKKGFLPFDLLSSEKAKFFILKPDHSSEMVYN